MAKVKKIKKAQGGAGVPKGMVESEMFPGKMIPKSQSNYENGKFAASLRAAKGSPTKSKEQQKFKQQAAETISSKKAAPKKDASLLKKAKAGGSFPDLNKDGKITKADILKGRGVIAKKGAKVSKAMAGCKACWGSKMKKK